MPGTGTSVPVARLAKQAHHLADRIQALAPDHLGARQRLVGAGRIGGEGAARAGEVEHHDGQRVGHDVVDVACDARPLWPLAACSRRSPCIVRSSAVIRSWRCSMRPINARDADTGEEVDQPGVVGTDVDRQRHQEAPRSRR